MQTVSSADRSIDVWWRDDPSGRLMLLLAHLMTRNAQWEEARIRLLTATSDPKNRTEAVKEDLRLMLEEIRIDAAPQVITDPDEQSIATNSEDASLVLMPFRMGNGKILGAYNTDIDDLARRGMMVALVLAAEDIDLDAEPEEGKHGEVAAALDALTAVGKKAGQLEKEATKALKKAAEAVGAVKNAERANAEKPAV